jgi:polar amino acid transport system substrate-binding protein
MNRRLLHAFLLTGMGCATYTVDTMASTTPSSAVPGQSLRVAINHGNAVLAKFNPGTGQLSGVSVDIAQELGKVLGATIELVGFDAANKSVEAVRQGLVDFGFFAIDPARSQGLRFTPAYLVIEGAYAVPQNSSIQTLSEVDRPGVRVVVAERSAYDLYLGRTLKEATLVKTVRSDEVVARMVAGSFEVAAGVKQQLENDLQKHHDLRLIQPSFMQIQQAMATAESKPELLAELQRLLEQLKASGFIRESLRRHQIDNVAISP